MQPRPTPDVEVQPMGDVISLRNTSIDLTSDVGHAFVVDCVRAGEGILTDKELQEKYELSPADWQNITKDMALGRAIRAERERRVLLAPQHEKQRPSILSERHQFLIRSWPTNNQTQNTKLKQFESCGKPQSSTTPIAQRKPNASSSGSTSPPAVATSRPTTKR